MWKLKVVTPSSQPLESRSFAMDKGVSFLVPGTKKLTPLSIAKDLDSKGWLEGVTTFNFHMHLPHYALTTDDTKSIHVLAKQPIDVSRPHPFTEAGNREFNTFLWMPPNNDRAGNVLVADSTIFSTL